MSRAMSYCTMMMMMNDARSSTTDQLTLQSPSLGLFFALVHGQGSAAQPHGMTLAIRGEAT